MASAQAKRTAKAGTLGALSTRSADEPADYLLASITYVQSLRAAAVAPEPAETNSAFEKPRAAKSCRIVAAPSLGPNTCPPRRPARYQPSKHYLPPAARQTRHLPGEGITP